MRTTSNEPRSSRGEQPTCPFCESGVFGVVGATGIGNQVSVLRCENCDHEWEEVLTFRYRRWSRAEMRGSTSGARSRAIRSSTPESSEPTDR